MKQTIEITGMIVDDVDMTLYKKHRFDVTSPSKVKDILKAAEGADIDVNINSSGGDVNSAREIYSALRTYNGNVHIHVTGLAASAASIIMCARKCDITPVGQVMLHRAYGKVSGNKNELLKATEIYENFDRTIAAAYVEKTGMTEEKALELMDRSTWLTASEAVNLGLCDSIMPAAAPEKITADKSKANESEVQKASASYKFLKLKGVQHNDD